MILHTPVACLILVMIVVSTGLSAEPALTANAGGCTVIVPRTSAEWLSQQVQEPCILPNPKDPTRLVMFYSGVPASNRNLCYIGKAWAMKSDPFTWHQV